MISKVNEGASLEEIRVGLNEVVNLLVWKNPLAEVEKATKQHLEGYDRRIKAQIAEELRQHNKDIADTREDLKKVLEDVKKELENLKELKKEITGYKKEITEDLSKSIEGIVEQHKKFESKVIAQQKEFSKEVDEKLDVISDIQEVVNKNKEIMSQFINFYAQVGLHVGGLCDGKK